MNRRSLLVRGVLFLVASTIFATGENIQPLTWVSSSPPKVVLQPGSQPEVAVSPCGPADLRSRSIAMSRIVFYGSAKRLPPAKKVVFSKNKMLVIAYSRSSRLSRDCLHPSLW